MTRSFATFGILGGGALSLISGAALLVTLTRRTIPALFLVFVVAVVITALSMIAYVSTELSDRRSPDDQ
ncbi:MAG: hypothetical protein HKN07_02675 [Acidimicrobiia bacterium]|nr:hypothetical protein [Acidimicrobiia bacterium]